MEVPPLNDARPIEVLKRLISIPSISRNEEDTAEFLFRYLMELGAEPRRHFNNVWAVAPGYNPSRKTLLLNAHHDTVKPTSGYTRNPFAAEISDGKLYGLGSNDDGASLVSLIEVFMLFRDKQLPFNLIFAACAEEEVTGEKGMRAMLTLWQQLDMVPHMAIIGEPTDMDAAIGERGLVVLDCIATARGGHAARREGENALYKAIDDINTLRKLRFTKVSQLLGQVKITVTQIEAGRQHNVLPERCKFVVDVRTTDAYTNEETVELIRAAIKSEAMPRSTRIRASAINEHHPLVLAALKAGAKAFVSPTTSDQSVLPMVDTLKIGPGKSSRSHTADEYIEIAEIDRGIKTYIEIINNLAHETLE